MTAIPKKLRFSLDVPAEDFFQWFWHYTVSEEGIYICQLNGQEAYFAFDGHSKRQTLKIEGYRGESSTSSVRIAEPWLIRFAVNDHGKRITVVAEQRDIVDPALAVEVSRYFALLLAAIADEYPEARATIAPTEPQPAAEPPKPAAPWEVIPNEGWNRKAVELWHAGYTSKEIARMIDRDLASKTILNVLSDLRRIYGTEVVPERRSQPRPGQKPG